MRLRHSLIQMGRFRRFRFGGVSFFCSTGKDYTSFCQWDYRSFTCVRVCSGVVGCSWSYTPWRTHRYPVCPIWPSCAITIEDPRLFFAHTLRHLLVEDVNFLFHGPPEWTFFWVYVKADFETSTLICRLPMGTPWVLVSDDASICCARKRRVNNEYLCDE
jgi:hypothetical protein